MSPILQIFAHSISFACVQGSTIGTNNRPISFKVLPMVPLVIQLEPMVPMLPILQTTHSVGKIFKAGKSQDSIWRLKL